MQRLVESMVRFSTAMTLFGVQQIQNAVEGVSDSHAGRRKIGDSLDSITEALEAQLDESKRPAVESVSNLVDKTREAFDVPVLDTKKFVENATDVFRKTADTMADAISKASPNSKKKKKHTDEPVSASTILNAEG